MKLQDYTGLRFGKLIVVNRAPNVGKATAWSCQCDCGSTRIVLSQHLRSGDSKSCGCGIRKGENHKDWQGTGQISGAHWGSILRTSKSRRIGRQAMDFDITIDFIADLFDKQFGKCALSGLSLTAGNKNRTASLDRIDSNKGYIMGNVQWVHKDVNRMKNVYPQEYFLDICRLVTESQKDE